MLDLTRASNSWRSFKSPFAGDEWQQWRKKFLHWLVHFWGTKCINHIPCEQSLYYILNENCSIHHLAHLYKLVIMHAIITEKNLTLSKITIKRRGAYSLILKIAIRQDATCSRWRLKLYGLVTHLNPTFLFLVFGAFVISSLSLVCLTACTKEYHLR